MSSPTQLQDVYDCFIAKIDENMSNKEAMIYQWLISAISKCKKFVRHSLSYILYDPVPPATESYDGQFNDTLDDDEIELIAMQMKYEYYNRKNAYLLGLRRDIGTKDFNLLPDKKRELDGIQNSLRILKEDIDDLRQQFNTYKYN